MHSWCHYTLLKNAIVKQWQASEIGTASKKRTKCLFPKCPLFGGSTVYISAYIASHFSYPCQSAPVDNRSDVLASNERLPVHMDLSTVVTGVSSVSNTKAVKGRTGCAVQD